MLVESKISPMNYINTLWIKEKYPLIKKISPSFLEQEYRNWRNRKNIISNESFSYMLSESNYEKDIFSNCLIKNIEENKEEISGYLLKKNGFSCIKKL